MIYTEDDYQRFTKRDTPILLMDCLCIHPTLFEEHLLSVSTWGARYAHFHKNAFKRIRTDYGQGKSNIDFMDHHVNFGISMLRFKEIYSQPLEYELNKNNLISRLTKDQFTKIQFELIESTCAAEAFFLMVSPFYLDNWLSNLVRQVEDSSTRERALYRYYYLKSALEKGIESWRQRFKGFIEEKQIKLPQFLKGDQFPYSLEDNLFGRMPETAKGS